MKLCFVRNYLDYKQGDIKDVDDGVADVLLDGGYAVELPAEEAAEEAGTEGTDEPKAEKKKSVKDTVEKKAAEITDQVEASLKKIANRAARSEPGADAPAKVRVIRDGERHKSFGHWIIDAYKFQVERDTASYKRLMSAKAAAGNDSTTATAGLELIPRYWADEIFTPPTSGLDLMAMCTQFPMENQQTLNIPAGNQNDPGSNGTIAYFKSEATALTISTLKTGNAQLNQTALTVLQVATDQLMRFNPYALASYYKSEAGKASLFKKNQKAVRGNGTDEPKGILNSPALVTVASDAHQAVNTITWSNIKRMRARRAEGLDDYVWLVNQSALPQVEGLTDDNGNSIYLPANVGKFPNLAWKPEGSLYGDPLFVTQHASEIGDVGDIILVSMRSFAHGFTSEETAESIHVYFLTNEHAMRVVSYHDMRSLWLLPKTPDRGTNTLSPHIVLADRNTSS